MKDNPHSRGKNYKDTNIRRQGSLEAISKVVDHTFLNQMPGVHDFFKLQYN